MPDKAHTAVDMISGMSPELLDGDVVYITTTDPSLAATLAPNALSTFKESEGMSMIVPVDLARKFDLSIDTPMRCITLNVYSSLEGFGLTAAVASALADASIACNMVAAFHHDHVFVLSDKCDQAINVLNVLQARAAKDC